MAPNALWSQHLFRSDLRRNRKILKITLHPLGVPKSQVQYVQDRTGADPGHVLDGFKIQKESDWKSEVRSEKGMGRKSGWYHTITEWLDHARSGEPVNYEKRRYTRRTANSQKVISEAPHVCPGSSFLATMVSDAAYSRALPAARR